MSLTSRPALKESAGGVLIPQSKTRCARTLQGASCTCGGSSQVDTESLASRQLYLQKLSQFVCSICLLLFMSTNVNFTAQVMPVC